MNFTLCDLAKSLEQMARCNIVCFVKGGKNQRSVDFSMKLHKNTDYKFL